MIVASIADAERGCTGLKRTTTVYLALFCAAILGGLALNSLVPYAMSGGVLLATLFLIQAIVAAVRS